MTFKLAFLIVLIILFVLLVIWSGKLLGETLEKRRTRTAILSKERQKQEIEDEIITEKGYWYNKEDVEGVDSIDQIRYQHHFSDLQECALELIAEMYDCGLVRTEELYATAYGREALTADAPIYKTTGIVEDEDYAEALKNLPPVSEEATKIIYEKWTGYVKQLLDLVEIFASDNDIATIVDILMLYGKKDLTVLLHSPE